MKRVNKFCFGAIYNGRLWEKELGVSAQYKAPKIFSLVLMHRICAHVATFAIVTVYVLMLQRLLLSPEYGNTMISVQK